MDDISLYNGDWRDKKILAATKMKIYRRSVRSMLTHNACETWLLPKDQKEDFWCATEGLNQEDTRSRMVQKNDSRISSAQDLSY